MTNQKNDGIIASSGKKNSKGMARMERICNNCERAKWGWGHEDINNREMFLWCTLCIDTGKPKPENPEGSCPNWIRASSTVDKKTEAEKLRFGIPRSKKSSDMKMRENLNRQWGVGFAIILGVILLFVIMASIESPPSREPQTFTYYCNICQERVGGHVIREWESSNGGFMIEEVRLDCGHTKPYYD